MCLAGRDSPTTTAAQEALTSLHFRIYRTDDVIGVLLGGARAPAGSVGCCRYGP